MILYLWRKEKSFEDLKIRHATVPQNTSGTDTKNPASDILDLNCSTSVQKLLTFWSNLINFRRSFLLFSCFILCNKSISSLDFDLLRDCLGIDNERLTGVTWKYWQNQE